MGDFRDECRNEKRERRDKDNDEGDLCIYRKHKNNSACDGNDARQKLRKALEHTVRDLLDINGNTADKISSGAAVNVAYREKIYLFINLGTKIVYRAVGNSVRADSHYPAEESREQNDCTKLYYYRQKRIEINIALADDKVNAVTDENGRIKRKSDADNCRNERDYKEREIRLCVPQHSSENGGLFFFFLIHCRLPPPLKAVSSRSHGKRRSFQEAPCEYRVLPACRHRGR